jgi:hypothetical protein
MVLDRAPQAASHSDIIFEGRDFTRIKTAEEMVLTQNYRLVSFSELSGQRRFPGSYLTAEHVKSTSHSAHPSLEVRH